MTTKSEKPKTANELFADAMLRHQTYLLRYTGYVRNRMIELLAKSEEDIAVKIRGMLKSGKGLVTSKDWQRLQALQQSIDAIRSGSWKEANQYMIEQMVQLSNNEPVVLSGLVQTVLPVVYQSVLPMPSQLRAIALSRPFEGRILKDWANSMEAADLHRIHTAIQLGMVQGEDSATIARRVVGTVVAQGRDGVLEQTSHGINAVVRTAVNHIGAYSRAAYYDENSDLFDQERFVATLDSRTTPICRSLDGHMFPLGQGATPPMHMACRSLRVPVLDGELLGNRPANPTTEKILLDEYTQENGLPNVDKRSQLPKGTKGDYDQWARKRKRELIGQVPATETYQTWLTKQSAKFQDEVLGPSRAKLFREGGLTLDQFVAKDGSEIPLKELSARHAEAFKAAGLTPAMA